MNTSFAISTRVGWALVTTVLMPLVVWAQLISLKSIPVATGDQFLIFPSENLAMGAVSIALEDSLLDPFVNPAKGAYLTTNRLLTSPVYYRVSQGDGSGRTLPMGVLHGSDHWFGGLVLAVQQLETAGSRSRWGWREQQSLADKSTSNTYAFGILGKTFPSMSLTFGASVFWADLSALDGVDLLYANSQGIDQFGHMADYRAGVFKTFENDAMAELLVLFNRLNMTHNVRYVDWGWGGNNNVRIDKNLDHTDTWGVHVRYVLPPGESGWRSGVILTANTKTHPKIPNYELMNIPRDPGDSRAYNVGVGFSRKERQGKVGMDLIYEPIYSSTWAATDTMIETPSGTILNPGDKTVVNDFEFSNYHLRLGLAHEGTKYGFQLGLIMRSIRYFLHQDNRVEETKRDQNEDWVEWTPSWGITLKFPEFHIRYVRRWTTGTGRPGVGNNNWGRGGMLDGAFVGGDFIVAPSGSLTLQEASVITHQISVSVPLRD